MHLRVLVATSIVACSVLAAAGGCVGDDPVLGGPKPDAGGASSSGEAPLVDATTSSDATDDAMPAPRPLGVFLTSTTYPADFAAALHVDGSGPSASEAWSFVDELCKTVATAGALPNSRGYRAMLVIADKLSEVSRFNQLKVSPPPTARWCAVSPATHQPSCTPTVAVIFDSPEAIQRGPQNTLITNELGGAVPSTRFWSGMHVPEDGGLVEADALTCGGWSSRTQGSEAGVGSVAAVAPGATGELAWFGAGRAECAAAELPLLCIEVDAP